MKKKHTRSDAPAIADNEPLLSAADFGVTESVEESLKEFGPLLTHDQVAKLLGIHTNTLYWWCVRGFFPRPIVIGPRLKRWPKEVVRAYLIERAARKDGDA